MSALPAAGGGHSSFRFHSLPKCPYCGYGKSGPNLTLASNFFEGQESECYPEMSGFSRFEVSIHGERLRPGDESVAAGALAPGPNQPGGLGRIRRALWTKDLRLVPGLAPSGCGCPAT